MANAPEWSNMWLPIESAPKDATDVLLVAEKDGQRHAVVGHFAEGGGEDQPRFGPDWFRWTGYDFTNVVGKIAHWAPLPVFPRWIHE